MSYSHRDRGRSRLSRAYIRVPLKFLVLVVVTFFVLFPDPVRFARHLSHVSDLNAMIEPDAEQLAPWETEVLAWINNTEHTRVLKGKAGKEAMVRPREVQRHVERLVYDKVKYGWDWDVWGAADYMPTVDEMFEYGAQAEDGVIREDCDGRAVMAASLMRRLGYKSSIVTDLRHVWVVTPRGEWMGPGRKKTMRSTPEGNRTRFLATLGNMPVSLAYGIAVFPLWRELIIFATAFVLMMHRNMRGRAAIIAAVLILQGLLFMRAGYATPGIRVDRLASWPAWIGFIHITTGYAYLLWNARKSRVAHRFSAGGAN